jgi:hypothetical protein
MHVRVATTCFKLFLLFIKKNVPNKYDINVRRDHVLEDSFRAVFNAPGADYLKTRPWVIFDGEVGLDYGGVQR